MTVTSYGEGFDCRKEIMVAGRKKIETESFLLRA